MAKSQKRALFKKVNGDIDFYKYLGLFFIFFIIGGVSLWSYLAEVQGAVIASSTLSVQSSSKQVQHLEGGIISKINVKEGQVIKKGDVLFVLDETEFKANLAALDANLNELMARQARLIAERDGKAKISFSQDLVQKSKQDPTIASLMSGQKRLIEARSQALTAQREQLEQRVEQLKSGIKGIKAQQAAKEEQISYIEDELEGLEGLHAQGLVQKSRLLALKRENARLQGERGQFIENQSRLNIQMGETKIQIRQLDKENLSQIITELRDVSSKILEAKERRTALAAKLKRTKILASQDGKVHQLAVHTIGGVVSPGQPLMLIVPENEQLVLKGQVTPQDIDEVYIGQKARVMFSAFNMDTTPELNGVVIHVGADAVVAGENQPPFYEVRIDVPKKELARLDKNLKLFPGLPAEVFIQTKKRKVINYLLEPLTAQFRRAMREP